MSQRLRVEPAGELGVGDEVAEEDRDRLAALDRASRVHVHVSNVHPRAYDFEVGAEEATGLAVEVSDLVKRYPKSPVNAVDGVSFGVAAGEVFGLLGPNGAGKTTTVGMLTTRVRPTAGTARLGGVDVVRDPVRARVQLAVVPQQSNLDRSISIRDNLVFHAAYHSVPAREREAARRRAARPVRSSRPRKRQARLLLRRTVAARDDRARSDARATRALPRRADHGSRSGGAPLRLGPAARAARLRRHAHPHDSRHGRGGAARRPGRDHGPREAARSRHAGGSDALARGRGHARARRRPACRRRRRRCARRADGGRPGRGDRTPPWRTAFRRPPRPGRCGCAFTSRATPRCSSRLRPPFFTSTALLSRT